METNVKKISINLLSPFQLNYSHTHLFYLHRSFNHRNC